MEKESIVVIADDEGKEHDFGIVLRVPYEGKEYAVLHPVDNTYPGMTEDDCAIFLIDGGDERDATLTAVDDEEIMNAVYEKYVEWANEEEEADGGEDR